MTKNLMALKKELQMLYLQDTLSVGELLKLLSKYPKKMKVIITWESTLHKIEKENIYESDMGYLFLDADNNFYKKDYAKDVNENE